jgi:hypothetical protein
MRARVVPQLAGDLHGLDPSFLPPSAFIAQAMHKPMMNATQRDREFIAGLASERSWLCEAEMVRVRGFAATD